jgi:hypothetical protein
MVSNLGIVVVLLMVIAYEFWRGCRAGRRG